MKARNVLNNSELLRLEAPRCYLYSEADEIVGWEDVEKHATQAEQKGWSVRREKFHRSPHVSHLKEDEERYWSTVKAVWEAGCQAPVGADYNGSEKRGKARP